VPNLLHQRRRPAEMNERLKHPSCVHLETEGRPMALEGLIIWLIIGAIAGWLAGQIIAGGGFGLVGNIVLGIIGAVVAGWLLPRLGLYIGGGLLGDIINATIGALIVIFILRLVAR
jgi:uncharacterized membrane protein YeaQ/YmgE (transglycosylase-associated protein family)